MVDIFDSGADREKKGSWASVRTYAQVGKLVEGRRCTQGEKSEGETPGQKSGQGRRSAKRTQKIKLPLTIQKDSWLKRGETIPKRLKASARGTGDSARQVRLRRRDVKRWRGILQSKDGTEKKGGLSRGRVTGKEQTDRTNAMRWR